MSDLRRWQGEALDVITAWARQPEPEPAIVQAVMGAGKSRLIAEVIGELDVPTTVVTTPTQALVEQLSATLEAHGLEVGAYWQRARDTAQRVVVACDASAVALAEELARRGRAVDLWIADEAHRTECGRMRAAYETLAPRLALGCSATPYRAQGGLSIWRSQLYGYGAADALRDGVVVPWRVRPWTGAECSADDACIAMICSAVDSDMGPGLVNATTIDDAEAFAEMLGGASIRAEVVHSRQARGEAVCVLERLHTGEISVAVHVAMLSEGVDLPWLRWLCLRRPVGSRVRFAQEVGRVLRSHPGKAEAVIFDPLDLFGSHRLEYASVLACDVDDTPPLEAARAAAAAPVVAEQLELWLRSGVAGVPAVVMDPAVAYVRQLVLDLEAEGACKRRVASRVWRSEPATIPQVRLVRGMLSDCKDTKSRRGLRAKHIRSVPAAHRHALRVVCRLAHRGLLDRGACADLISTLIAIRDHRGWPLPKG